MPHAVYIGNSTTEFSYSHSYQVDDHLISNTNTESRVNIRNLATFIHVPNEFTDIGSIKAAGNASYLINYYFVDETPNAGKNYYRLKQINNDDSYEYSNVITITAPEKTVDDTKSFKLYPNPTNDILWIDFSDELNEINVFNTIGHLVLKTTPTEKHTSINISDLPTGIYFVKIKNKNFTIYKN